MTKEESREQIKDIVNKMEESGIEMIPVPICNKCHSMNIGLLKEREEWARRDEREKIFKLMKDCKGLSYGECSLKFTEGFERDVCILVNGDRT